MYNKRNFISGILMLGLGIILAILTAVKKPFEIENCVLICLLVVMGLRSIIRSSNKHYVNIDFIEENDERKKFIVDSL